ncbi:unnamed protein product [Adineta ricciae]|uniref:Uncharacterized protein n=1 Tax=Adineta ricciae TaxID=249248 RepID=A0A813Z3W2_ADIRI|nr:unnamed protein product [Adineta ricciae]CAF0941870.1 unnamed protein product [Adineta ricciae]
MTWNETIVLDNNDTMNLTNESLLTLSKSQTFLWNFNWFMISLATLALLLVIVLIGTGAWFWYNRMRHVRRRHSLPIAVDNVMETRKLQENQFSSSPIIKIPNKAPPVPPRPLSYTTTLSKVEYRSNL